MVLFLKGLYLPLAKRAYVRSTTCSKRSYIVKIHRRRRAASSKGRWCCREGTASSQRENGIIKRLMALSQRDGIVAKGERHHEKADGIVAKDGRRKEVVVL